MFAFLRIVLICLAGPLGALVARAQAVPAAAGQLLVRAGAWPPVPDPVYYIDGQRADSAAIASLRPQAIASLDVVKGAAARALTKAATGRGVVIVTTKRGQPKRRTRAFAQQVARAVRENSPVAGAAGPAEATDEPITVRYYLNGQLSSRAALGKIDSRTVSQVRALRAERAAAYCRDRTVTEVFLVEATP